MPVVYGMNHASAPLPVREKVAFPEPELKDAMARLRRSEGVEEAFILSTCNRTEIIVHMRPEQAPAALAGFLTRERPVSGEELERHCYLYTEREAVRHVFRTAASLDSMVVGEAQILGQVKEAYALAGEVGALGPVLDALLRRAFTVAKRVRTETGIARHPVSIAYAAVGLARDIFGDLAQRTVMIVGAGKMARLAAQHLAGSGAQSILVANRSYQRADELARELGGSAVPFDRLFEEMERADIVIASTAAPHLVILREHALKLSRARRGRPIFFIDIAVPRDVDPKVNEIDNVYLYDIDDLQRVVQVGLSERQKELTVAEAIVERETETFLSWMKSLEVTPTIVELRRHLHGIASHEVERFRSKLAGLTPGQEEAVRQMAASLVNKLLHPPTLVLKRLASQDGAGVRIRLVRELFGIDPPPDTPPGTVDAEEDPPAEDGRATAGHDTR
jgi:glutamyl-tRNA reductase